MGTLVDQTLSHYRIVEKIGEGGMGEVYRAEDTLLGRDVAIKVIPPELALDPDRIKRFEQEARAAGSLSHPNVCAIHDVGTDSGSPFVVMELLEGETLREKLAAGPIPIRKALDYAAQTAHGLAAAHEKGIVHRDLKPANVFVTKDGRVKVLDFGLAKLTRPKSLTPSGDATTSIAGGEPAEILGSVGYMSPEQALGRAVDYRSDLFSLGTILYELLSGKRAFHGVTYVDTLHAIVNEEPEPLSSSGRPAPPAVEMIVRRCLEKNPEERFQSARDLAFDLENLSGTATVPAGAVTVAPALRRRTVRMVPAVAGTALLVAASVVAGHFLWKPVQPVQPTYHRLTFQRGWVTSARLAADGKSVVYSASWEGRPSRIYEVRTDLSSNRELDLSGVGLWDVSSTNTLAVGARTLTWEAGLYRTLSVLPLAGGAPRELLEGVSAADWSPDGKTLAVARSVAGEEHIEMPPGRRLARVSGYVSCLSVSRDGRWVAFAEHPNLGDTRGRIAVVDARGGKKMLTPEWDDLWGVGWSPSGSEVWFCASEMGEVRSALRAVTLDGRQRKVLQGPTSLWLQDVAPDGRVLLASVETQRGVRGRRAQDAEERELSWLDFSYARDISRDGERLLLQEYGEGEGPSYATYLRAMDGSAPVRLGDGMAGSLSPDGAWVLGVRFAPPQRLMLLPTGPGEARPLASGSIERYEQATSWLPDGRSFLFVGAEAGQPSRTYVQRVTGGLPRAVTPPGVRGVTISPDGRWVAAAAPLGRLMLYPIAGGAPKDVAALEVGDVVYQWSADGRYIYTAQPGPRLIVSRLHVATGAREPWRTFQPPDPAGSAIQNLVLTPDARSYAYSYSRALHTLFLVEGLK